MQNYNTLHDLPTKQTDRPKLSPENMSSTDIPQLEQNLMSLPELTPDKVTKLQKIDTICKTILQHIDCSKHDNYLTVATGILHNKVIVFNGKFSAIVIPQILIKYLLHASQDSLGHIGATNLPFSQEALLLSEHEKKNTPIC